MTHISEATMEAFRDELQKLALPLASTVGRMAASVGRFGGRQLHSVTGWKPKGDWQGALQMASHEATGPAQGALRKAEDMGLSSIPGVARAVGKHGLVPVLRAGAEAQWKGVSPGMKALTVGLPAAGLTHAVMAQPAEGSSKEEAVGEQLGGLVGGIAGAPMPIVGSAVLGTGLGLAGKYVGRGVHKVHTMFNPGNGLHPSGPFPRQSTDLTQESGQAAPSETIMTSRASGSGGGFE